MLLLNTPWGFTVSFAPSVALVTKQTATANLPTPTADAGPCFQHVHYKMQETARNHAVGSNRIIFSWGKHSPNSLQSEEGLVKQECLSRGQCVIKLEAADIPDGDLYNDPILLPVCLEKLFFFLFVFEC